MEESERVVCVCVCAMHFTHPQMYLICTMTNKPMLAGKKQTCVVRWNEMKNAMNNSVIEGQVGGRAFEEED